MQRLIDTVSLWAIVMIVSGQPAAAAVLDDSKFEGQWKLVLLPVGSDFDFFVLTAEQKDGQLSATIGDTQQFLSGSKLTGIEQKNGAISLTFKTAGQESLFKGRLVKEGDHAGQVLGSIRFRGRLYPARLQKSESDKVSQPMRSQIARPAAMAARDRDPRERVTKLEKLLKEHADNAASHLIYVPLLASAEAAKLTPKTVRQYYDQWIGAARPYGDDWVAEIRTRALQALDGQKSQAKLALELAVEADRALGKNATTEQQAAAVRLLANAAKLSGDSQLARTSAARSEKLELKLDEEYNEKVPPFKPEVFAGRKNAEDDRVVLLELFTGAECPPCVAAVVAFDGAIQSYSTNELITLQYHLHIPGPDPFTIPQGVKRSRYYKVRGTPATYFNGEVQAQGGGPMAGARLKYDQYLPLINEGILGKKQASIKLDVRRTGETIRISASAQADRPRQAAREDEKGEDQSKDAEKNRKEEKDRKEEPQLRLRLVLTEKAVRYVGGNRIRFHHHVVRDMPGGAEGAAFEKESCQTKATIDLNELRSQLTEELDRFGKSRFRHAFPPIDLQNLSVVAFVQDDADQSVLHAITAEVPDSE